MVMFLLTSMLGSGFNHSASWEVRCIVKSLTSISLDHAIMFVCYTLDSS
jgi:hypothetical protein